VLVGSCVLLEIEQLNRLKYCYISNMSVIQKGVLHQVKKVPQARCAAIENCEEAVSVCESKEKNERFFFSREKYTKGFRVSSREFVKC
jgi:hypothetical protein